MSVGPVDLRVLAALLLMGFVCHAANVPASQWSGGDFRNATLRRHRAQCVENQQYPHQGLCCLNCRAGAFVKKACEREGEVGVCEPCEHGQTYTEHPNGMDRCLPCNHCRQDQIEVVACSTTANTRCQCRAGTFCVPDQACEVCKRCARCKAGEEEVRKCTPFSNTVCQKRGPFPNETAPAPPPPTSASDSQTNTAMYVLIVLLVVVFFAAAFALWWFMIKHRSCQAPWAKSHCQASEIVKIPINESQVTAEERPNHPNTDLQFEEPRPESRPLLQETQAGMTKAAPPLEDEDRGLGDSLPNTTSSSQTSLSALPPPTTSSCSTPTQSPSTPRQLPADVDDPLQSRLLPLQGSEKSLKKSFDLFDEYLDVRIHNKFFRFIGISDNHIRLAESGAAADKVYELLKNWMQRRGLKADINDLLDALLSLDQRRSAECIASAALRRGYYRHADPL